MANKDYGTCMSYHLIFNVYPQTQLNHNVYKHFSIIINSSLMMYIKWFEGVRLALECAKFIKLRKKKLDGDTVQDVRTYQELCIKYRLQWSDELGGTSMLNFTWKAWLNVFTSRAIVSSSKLKFAYSQPLFVVPYPCNHNTKPHLT